MYSQRGLNTLAALVMAFLLCSVAASQRQNEPRNVPAGDLGRFAYLATAYAGSKSPDTTQAVHHLCQLIFAPVCLAFTVCIDSRRLVNMQSVCASSTSTKGIAPLAGRQQARSVSCASSGNKVDLKKAGVNKIKNKSVRNNLQGRSDGMKDNKWVDASGRGRTLPITMLSLRGTALLRASALPRLASLATVCWRRAVRSHRC